MFGNAPNESHVSAFPLSPLGEQRPPAALAPAAVPSTTQLSPDQVINDHSSEQAPKFADEASRACNVLDDLPSKDNLFGRRSEHAETASPQTSLAEAQDKKEETLGEEGNMMKNDQEAKDALFGVPASEVSMTPIRPEELTSAAIPQAPSSIVHTVGTPQVSPDGIVKVHETASKSQMLLQDTDQGDVLSKDLQAKDDLFNKQHTPPEAAGDESIMNAVSGPIMGDIAKELEDAGHGEDDVVEVGLKVDGGQVSIQIDSLQGKCPMLNAVVLYNIYCLEGKIVLHCSLFPVI